MSQKYFVLVKNGVTYWQLGHEMCLLHRLDGPAIERPDGYRVWYRDGLRHREDGPAIEYPKGHREWYQYGKRHRLDGPAVEHPDGKAEYWIEGVRYEYGAFVRRARELTAAMVKEMTMAALEKALGHPIKIIK